MRKLTILLSLRGNHEVIDEAIQSEYCFWIATPTTWVRDDRLLFWLTTHWQVMAHQQEQLGLQNDNLDTPLHWAIGYEIALQKRRVIFI